MPIPFKVPACKLWGLMKEDYELRDRMNYGAFGQFLLQEDKIKKDLKENKIIAESDNKGLACFVCYKEEPDKINLDHIALRKDLRLTFKGSKMAYKLIHKVLDMPTPVYTATLMVEPDHLEMFLKLGFEIYKRGSNIIYLRR